jgi:hypothetical protein
MQCPQCGAANSDGHMFCLGCGGRLDRAPVGEAAGHWPKPAHGAPQGASGPRCAQCGGGRTVQGAVGPALGVRVFTQGRQDDLPLAQARVCADCGHVSLFVPDDTRRFLAGLVGG